MADIEVKLSGPVFDGRAIESMRRMSEEIQKEIATYAEDSWQSFMDASFRHSTGRYQLFVNVARRDKDLVVNDGWPESHLQYGPWLEGVGSRNSPVTRFPGYFALKRAADHTESDVPNIAEPIVTNYVAEANE
ncbi:hypothetical protein Caci_2845 [Catenulispora acidiphila DSM 44928]|uniref:HK97 gp10 family phage protein n=1 Tax=Catenulispora acidiphila (strain DSM 44928 / JCM 14897 / NBRC 102108 / NRRL B-24433 / ID139908) TaxID=479433 RepID=C7Q179_CATAD|nr:hypothetical protein [Catenulispora acidiphila]ACU71754.1 hypothetical protein Caci_2845 [Catenulispora acidiphila DSM 44928]